MKTLTIKARANEVTYDYVNALGEVAKAFGYDTIEFFWEEYIGPYIEIDVKDLPLKKDEMEIS